MTMRRSAVALVLAIGLLLPACSSKKSDPLANCKVLKQSADGSTNMTVVAKNLAFDVTCVKIKPGPLAITYKNHDQGVAHNLHVTGNGVNASTDLKPGVNTQHLRVVLMAEGQYTFACDPHGTMEGKIIVAAKASA
jgi:plastocyanin